MKSVLVITPCNPSMLKSQGQIIAQQLDNSGVRIGMLSAAKSGLGRFVDIAFRGPGMIKRHDILLVNMYGFRAFTYEALAVLYGRLFKRKVVVMIHGGWMADFIDRYSKFARFVLGLPHVVLTPHGFLEKELSDRKIIIDGTIPNFIEIGDYTFKLRSNLKPKFLFMRGTHHIYNPEMAIKAFAVIQKQIPKAVMTIAGRDNGHRSSLEKMSCELGLKNITFLGQVPKKEIPKLASEHDIYIQTNRVDNMPVTILEMWSLGIPVIATDVGGVPFLVNNQEDGILVENENFEQLAAVCLDLLKDPVLSERLSKNGRCRAEKLTWEYAKPLWEKMLFEESRV